MTTALEWIDLFDLLWNNIMSDMAPNIDDYEKSRFLTLALEQIVILLYEGLKVDGFESSELVRRQLANLLIEATFSGNQITSVGKKILNYSEYTVSLPSGTNELLVIVNERATIKNRDCCNTNKEVSVVPIKYDEVNKVLNNPFRRPNNNKVIRLDKKSLEIRLVTNNQLIDYTCEYLKKPSPIVLINLTRTNFSIDELQTVSDPICELDSALHRTILTQAVLLAAAAWASNNKN